MNKQKIIDLVKEKGYLQISGFNVNRAVYLFDEMLDIEESFKYARFSPDGFNWGYNGSGPTQLALAIALVFEDSKKAMDICHELKQVLVANIPKCLVSFDIRVKIEPLLDMLNGEKNPYDKNIHAYHFMEVKMGDYYIPRLLDFVNSPYKDFIIEEGTVEFDLLSNLTPPELDACIKYNISESKRKDVKNLSIIHKMKYDFEVDKDYSKTIKYCFKDGLGLGVFNGLNKEKYVREI